MDLLYGNTSSSETKGYSESSQLQGYGEEEAFDSAEVQGEDIAVDDTPQDEPMDEGGDTGMDSGDNFGSDDGFGDEGGDEEGKKVEDELNGVEDSEYSLVKTLRENMTTFYYNRENDLERVASSNLVTSEYGDEINVILEDYKSSLSLFKEYLRDTFKKESTSRKVNSFIEYKAIFNKMNRLLNEYFRKLNIQEELKER